MIEKHTTEFMLQQMAYKIHEYVTSGGELKSEINVADELKKHGFENMTVYNLIQDISKKHEYTNTVKEQLGDDVEDDDCDDVRAIGLKFFGLLTKADVRIIVMQ